MTSSLVGSEMCIRDSSNTHCTSCIDRFWISASLPILQFLQLHAQIITSMPSKLSDHFPVSLTRQLKRRTNAIPHHLLTTPEWEA
eukprot:4766471-Prorocentrum_lima.AAC.1